jgi:crotonobetainyl-CoA:carnitine CoA-transferase CaiB-like acyl-CoA transferase
MGSTPASTGVDSSLRGVRVVSLAENYPGPLCTQLLCDLGAEVIQVERPGGDPQRAINPWLFRSASLGKASVELDLKTEAGLEAARRLADTAQVFVEGFRPGVIDRLGLGFAAMSQRNPRIVYCSISGYGQTGPYRDLSGHNVNYEAATGVLDAVLRPELGVTHFPSGPPTGDITSGTIAALGIVAGLRKVSEGGGPVYLDVAIADSLAMTVAPNITRALNGDEPWPIREPAYGLFECSDGSLALGINYEDHFWRHVCAVLALNELAGLSREARVDRRHEIRRRIATILRERPVQYWLDAFGDLVPCSPVRHLGEVGEDPQIVARGLIIDARDEHGRRFQTVASPFARGVTDREVPALGAAAAGLTERELATSGTRKA